MLDPNPIGHHTILTQSMIDNIIKAVPQVLIQNQVAGLVGIPRQYLSLWLKYGERDIQRGTENSLFAQLYDRFYKSRAEVLRDKLLFLSTCPKNYGAITWIIEKCFREDFGAESEEMKQLKDLVFNQILPLIGKGVIPDGGRETKEVDSESSS